MLDKKVFFVAATALCAASCSVYDAEYSMDELKMETTVRDYTQNFEGRYGAIDPNHTWGFGDVTGDLATRSANKNMNEWESRFHLSVPGWPDVYENEDGTTGNNGYQCADQSHNYKGYQTAPDLNQVVPAGDVTDEEIQYVSWWFRTHKSPKSEIVHWSDFFVQEISSDYDRNADGSAIKTYKEYEWDQNKDNSTGDNNGKGAWKVTDMVLNEWKIDQFRTKTLGNDYDHVNDFNSQASNRLYDQAKVPMAGDDIWQSLGNTKVRNIGFYTSSGTEDFEAHYSSDSEWRNNFNDKDIWTIVHLTFTGKSGRKYDGWYLGFDFAFYKEMNHFSKWDAEKWPNSNIKEGKPGKYDIIEPDGYHSNWILKITPATPYTEDNGFTRRIMCEDLGNTCDFDFNDVVFDVTYNSLYPMSDGYYDATIILQAAGGTLPIYVGVDPSDPKNLVYEAHNMLGGNSTSQPVNVGDGMETAVAVYHIKTSSLNPDDIPVYVAGAATTATKNISLLPESGKGTSDAPQKICIPDTKTDWLLERHQIEDGYTYFDKWVQNESSAYDFTGETPWNTYEHSIQRDHLYNK